MSDQLQRSRSASSNASAPSQAGNNNSSNNNNNQQQQNQPHQNQPHQQQQNQQQHQQQHHQHQQHHQQQQHPHQQGGNPSDDINALIAAAGVRGRGAGGGGGVIDPLMLRDIAMRNRAIATQVAARQELAARHGLKLNAQRRRRQVQGGGQQQQQQQQQQQRQGQHQHQQQQQQQGGQQRHQGDPNEVLVPGTRVHGTAPPVAHNPLVPQRQGGQQQQQNYPPPHFQRPGSAGHPPPQGGGGAWGQPSGSYLAVMNSLGVSPNQAAAMAAQAARIMPQAAAMANANNPGGGPGSNRMSPHQQAQPVTLQSFLRQKQQQQQQQQKQQQQQRQRQGGGSIGSSPNANGDVAPARSGSVGSGQGSGSRSVTSASRAQAGSPQRNAMNNPNNNMQRNMPNNNNMPQHQQHQQQLHPYAQIMNERKSRSNMLRNYGEENPLFYERLVQLMGKKAADEMVREAVDETLKEEVEGGGGGGGKKGESAGNAGNVNVNAPQQRGERPQAAAGGGAERHQPLAGGGKQNQNARMPANKQYRENDVISIDDTSSEEGGETTEAKNKAGPAPTIHKTKHQKSAKPLTEMDTRAATKVEAMATVEAKAKAIAAKAVKALTATAKLQQQQRQKQQMEEMQQKQQMIITTNIPNPLAAQRGGGGPGGPPQVVGPQQIPPAPQGMPQLQFSPLYRSKSLPAAEVKAGAEKFKKRKADEVQMQRPDVPTLARPPGASKPGATAMKHPIADPAVVGPGIREAIKKGNNNKRAKTTLTLSKDLPVPDLSSIGNNNLLRTLFPDSSPVKVAAAAALGSKEPAENDAAAAAKGALSKSGSGTASSSAAASASSQGEDEDDPPGYDQFKVDPEFCHLIVESATNPKNKVAAQKSSNVGGLFVHGLLNIENELLKRSATDDLDPFVRAYVKDVISPYLNVPRNLAESTGQWEAYIHISSDNINEFARTVVFQRRKSMKSAVELAFYEIENNRLRMQQDMPGGGEEQQQTQQQQDNAPSKKPDIIETLSKNAVKPSPKKSTIKEIQKDARIKELERQLSEQKVHHKVQLKALGDKHFDETKECEKEYTEFVSKMLKKHRKEMADLRRDMKDMQNVHKVFLESYVEASLDELRGNNDSPQL